VRGRQGKPGLSLAPRVRGILSHHEQTLLGGLGLGTLLVAWEAFGRLAPNGRLFVSTPTAIAAAGARMWASAELVEHLWSSGTDFALGYLLAVGSAVPLGLLLGWYQRLGYLVNPILAAMYAAPRVALLPVLVLWLGIGMWSRVAVILLGAVFPICLNTIAGVKTIDATHLALARSFQARGAHLFRTIVLPSSQPFILAGLRLGIGRALVGVVVGEFNPAIAASPRRAPPPLRTSRHLTAPSRSSRRTHQPSGHQ
jgi:ABC-type nitrate/sulfonate/bicarbonate transport system permease component